MLPKVRGTTSSTPCSSCAFDLYFPFVLNIKLARPANVFVWNAEVLTALATHTPMSTSWVRLLVSVWLAWLGL